MLILIETPAVFALFQDANTKALNKIDNIYDYLKQAKILEANLLNCLLGSHLLFSNNLKILKKLKWQQNIICQEVQDQIAVQDKKLAKQRKNNQDQIVSETPVTEQLFRKIRSQHTNLIEGLSELEPKNMTQGLAYGLSRYKLKFSPEKRIALLDDLDKEINNYRMRLREWFGWHFPELGKIITDNLIYAKIFNAIGMRIKTSSTNLSDLLPENLEADVKQAIEISFGTEITKGDEKLILFLVDQVIELTEYRSQFSEYLKYRKKAIAVHQLKEGVNYRDMKAIQKGKTKPIQSQTQYQEETKFQQQDSNWMQKTSKRVKASQEFVYIIQQKGCNNIQSTFNQRTSSFKTSESS